MVVGVKMLKKQKEKNKKQKAFLFAIQYITALLKFYFSLTAFDFGLACYEGNKTTQVRSLKYDFYCCVDNSGTFHLD